MKEKIRVYVSGFKISALDYVDAGSMGHPCVTSRNTDSMFTEYQHLPKGSLTGYLTDDQIKTIDVVNKFCEENELEYEIVDTAKMSFIDKTKLVLRGIKAPAVTFKGEKIEGVPTKEELEILTTK